MTALGNITPTDGGGFKPVPSAKYVCEIVADTEPTPAKSGQGRWVKLTWKITKGEHAGRLIFQRINFQHSNPKTEDIAMKELGQIAFACGHAGANFDPGECHGIPCLVTVGIKDDPDGKYEPQNVVRRVEKLPEGPASSSPRSQPAPATGGNAPWR